MEVNKIISFSIFYYTTTKAPVKNQPAAAAAG
jgi:hypothetical protein